MKKSKKFIYLISPTNINKKTFFKNLSKLFALNKISYFQLRLKNYKEKEIIQIGKNALKICMKYKVKLIINDNPRIAKLVKANGCHLGQKDMKIKDARKILKNKIIGVTCHNSLKLVIKSIKEGADYVALGSFFRSNTKKSKFQADTKIISKVQKVTKKPTVLIGGINSKNYKKLLLHKPNFLAISGYIWNNSTLSPKEALKKLNYEN